MEQGERMGKMDGILSSGRAPGVSIRGPRVGGYQAWLRGAIRPGGQLHQRMEAEAVELPERLARARRVMRDSRKVIGGEMELVAVTPVTDFVRVGQEDLGAIQGKEFERICKASQ